MIVSVFKVDTSGNISLAVANLPYSSLQWTRKMSTCGEFAITIIGSELPFIWPGRYFVTVDSEPEIAIVEKVDYTGSSKPSIAISGRFGLSLWDNWEAGGSGATVSGANWRQACTQALSNWHMSDIPKLTLGSGTVGKNGSSYALSIGSGDSGMDGLLDVTSSNGAWTCIGYDRANDAEHIVARLVSGLDRTRSQSTSPIQVFSLAFGNASEVSYTGDYSVAATEVLAYAEKEQDSAKTTISRTIAVPGRDLSTQWLRRAFEDVSSLIDNDTTPTNALVDAAGALRCYDHMAELVIDATVFGTGYQTNWDLADLCEVEIPALGLAAQERVEEIRIVDEGNGVSVEATLGTKQISRMVRAMMGRR